MTPFDFVNAINHTKENIITEDNEKQYLPYITNRQLSYFKDTVVLANEMNYNHHLDNKMQFHFLLNIVRKRKRFSKWEKPTISNDLEAVQEYYGYSNDKARSALSILSPHDLKQIRKRMDKGGRK